MYKRFKIYTAIIIFISLLGVFLCHNGFHNHCLFCSRGVSDLEFNADNTDILSISDNSFQRVIVAKQISIPIISPKYVSLRAPPV